MIWIAEIERIAAARAAKRPLVITCDIDKPDADVLADLDLDEAGALLTSRALLVEGAAARHRLGARLVMKEPPHATWISQPVDRVSTLSRGTAGSTRATSSIAHGRGASSSRRRSGSDASCGQRRWCGARGARPGAARRGTP